MENTNQDRDTQWKKIEDMMMSEDKGTSELGKILRRELLREIEMENWRKYRKHHRKAERRVLGDLLDSPGGRDLLVEAEDWLYRKSIGEV